MSGIEPIRLSHETRKVYNGISLGDPDNLADHIQVVRVMIQDTCAKHQIESVCREGELLAVPHEKGDTRMPSSRFLDHALGHINSGVRDPRIQLFEDGVKIPDRTTDVQD